MSLDTTTAPRAIPEASSPAAPRRRPPRRIRRMTFDDVVSLVGSAVAALALMVVLFEHVFAGNGTVAFWLCWYGTFLAIYGVVLAMANPRPIVIDRLVATAMWAAAALVVFALGSTLVYTFASGWPAYTHLNFFTDTMAGVSPTAPLNKGGIAHAIVGTVVEVGLAVAVAIPFGVGTAIYMSEVGGPLSRLVRTVTEAMTALPEILAGLFVYVVLIVQLGWPRAGICAAAAMAVTMVPIIARASEVALRVVPGGLREASLALGASRWATVWKVVLPSARAGLATAVILGIARGVGETAIPLITSGASSFMTVDPTQNPMNSLPLFIYTMFTSHQPTAITRSFGAASVLLVIVLVLFVAARILSRQKGGRR